MINIYHPAAQLEKIGWVKEWMLNVHKTRHHNQTWYVPKPPSKFSREIPRCFREDVAWFWVLMVPKNLHVKNRWLKHIATLILSRLIGQVALTANRYPTCGNYWGFLVSSYMISHPPWSPASWSVICQWAVRKAGPLVEASYRKPSRMTVAMVKIQHPQAEMLFHLLFNWCG